MAIAALEGATVMVLNAIYEGDFVGFSYGFRPGRGPHDGLDALAVAIPTRKVNWILDANVQNFFGSVNQDWLVQFLEHRIGDKRIIRLIRKWLKAGVLEDGRLLETTEGTPQGSVVSPLLANVYLHYVYDLWVEQWRTRQAKGDMIVVRYADATARRRCDVEHLGAALLHRRWGGAPRTRVAGSGFKPPAAA
ncbi:reverse transcriptase domain-containing protein [Bradyrhizobium sp. CIR18]|uniref:reverse transcriptase domain-containing protein n=1 Tax=Bradyrhizobium sp. CIR18 TaxID=2663839 RepID=UPI001FEE21B5|nr:reverse transcriptase domain-containing protein [Bradyrhizobium sp. CIR18]